MITDQSKPPLKVAALIICAMAGTLLSSLLSSRTAFALCAAPVNTSYDFGPVEQQQNLPQVYEFFNNSNCDVTFNAVSNTDSTDFVIGNPPSQYTSCLPSYTLDGPSDCFFQVTFTPQGGPGQYNTTISAMVTINGQQVNVTYDTYGAEFSVSPPTDGLGNINNFPLVVPSNASPFYPGYASITLNSGNAKIKWDGKLSYQTSGQIPKSPASIDIKSFDTDNNTSYTFAFGQTPIPTGLTQPTSSKGLYQVAGGQLTLNATYNAGAHNDPETNQLIGTVSGIAGGICDATITSALSVYQGPYTQNLFELIASQESSYRQFSLVANFYLSPPPTPPALYGVNTLWPLESPPAKYAGGYAIGLMQDQLEMTRDSETQMSTAWNWVVNADTGYNIFQTKIKNVVGIQKKAQQENHSVPNLDSLQEEEMALYQYGGFGSPANDVLTQYFIPSCPGETDFKQCASGTITWQENPKGSGAGDDYVYEVYQQTPPTISCSN
jgi:hypothetical protein